MTKPEIDEWGHWDDDIFILESNPAPLLALMKKCRPLIHLPWTKDKMIPYSGDVVQIFFDTDYDT